MKIKIKYLAEVMRWFDRANGNTYHSVRVTRCRDGAVIAAEMTYGYGSSYEQTALKLMADHKWLPVKYRNGNGYLYNQENSYPLRYVIADGTKCDTINNGIL